MKDVEELVRAVLHERAADVDDGDAAAGLAERARRAGGRSPVRRTVATGVAAAAAVVVVLAVHLITDASGPSSLAPAAPGGLPGRGPATTVSSGWPFASVATLTSTSVGVTRSPFPPGRVPLTSQAAAPLTPSHPQGCRGFPPATPSTPEPGPDAGSASAGPSAGAGAASAPPASGSAPSGSPSATSPGDPFAWIALSPPPAVVAVSEDLDQVLDGIRFGGQSIDPPDGRSITVYVVTGPTARAAAAVAAGCARPDVPVRIRYVARGADALTGVGETLDRSLPASVRPLAVDDGGGRWLSGTDARRNRLCLYLDHGPVTGPMKRDLWIRYGDAVELWLLDSRTLLEPDPAWARG